jgi:hypothetical protein
MTHTKYPFYIHCFSALIAASLLACGSGGRQNTGGDVGDPCDPENPCREGLVCENGFCAEAPIECPAGTTPCGIGCCPAGTTCMDGYCCPDDKVCGDACCGPADRCEAGVCTSCPDPLCNGECCEEGETCHMGACCDEDKVCGDLCCGENEVCDAGQCWIDCGDGERCTNELGDEVCCAEGEICYFHDCITPGDPCTHSANCPEGYYCEPTLGRCLPVITGDDCTYEPPINPFTPAFQCSYNDPPDGDLTPGHVQVFGLIAADFDLDDNPDTIEPSIVFNTFPSASPYYHSPGVLRIIDGRTCSLLFSLNEDEADRTTPIAPPAAGDIDGDGRAEIVAVAYGGGLLAFDYDPAAGSFSRLWRSGTCNPDGTRTPDATGGADNWSGVSIHDLDDDGVPEIVFSGALYDSDGCLLGPTPGYLSYHRGLVSTVADVDEDGEPELVTGNGVFGYDPALRDFFMEDYFHGTALPQGRTAVADLMDVPLSTVSAVDPPEVAVIFYSGTTGQARIQTIEGDVVFGPYTQPGGGNGGPPTISDFDGDTLAEFAAAGDGSYTVYDPDCTPDPVGRAGGECASGRTDGILWTQPSQDHSSNVTGSSIFDFEGDGKAEAAYSDECFTRVYDGVTGDVIWSVASQSGTAYEYPVIMDVDGDFHTEIVMGINNYADMGCPATDPLFTGESCAVDADCAGFGLSCISDVCRAGFRGDEHGVYVYSDVEDRWVNSRPIWNQHAYYVTNVGDDGTIPASGDVERNWEIDNLNNFRQNILREGVFNAPDVVAVDPGADPSGCPARYTLHVRVLNQGSAGVAAGIPVGFYLVDGAGDQLIGAAFTTRPLLPGMSERVSVEWDVPASMGDLVDFDFYAVADDPAAGDEVAVHECLEDNNASETCHVHCSGVI